MAIFEDLNLILARSGGACRFVSVRPTKIACHFSSALALPTVPNLSFHKKSEKIDAEKPYCSYTMTSAQKAIKKVFLDSDVFTACLHHCLTSEKEEVLGLLIGKVVFALIELYLTIVRQVDEASFCHVLASIVMHRSDKQPDRVEISAPQLCIATAYADKLSVGLGESVRVIGWYHSHPHITVWPSHVDVNTQFTYQMLDSFVGLIFAVYQNDPGSAGNTVPLTGFQSVEDPTHPGRVVRKDIELQIVNKPMKLFNLKGKTSVWLNPVLT